MWFSSAQLQPYAGSLVDKETQTVTGGTDLHVLAGTVVGETRVIISLLNVG